MPRPESGRTKLELGLVMMLARVAGTGWGGIQQFQCFFVCPSRQQLSLIIGVDGGLVSRRTDVGEGMRMRLRTGSHKRRHDVLCARVWKVRESEVTYEV